MDTGAHEVLMSSMQEHFAACGPDSLNPKPYNLTP